MKQLELKTIISKCYFTDRNPMITFASSNEFPSSNFKDKRGLMHSPFISYQVILWGDASLCAQFLKETDRCFALQVCHV